MANTRPPHETLGILETASTEEIEEAYNRKKLYLNPANFEDGSREQKETEAYLLALDEARAALSSSAPREAAREPEALSPEPFGEPDFPILSPDGEARKKMYLSIAATITVAFLVMLLVSLSFTYTSGLKTDLAETRARIELLEAERDSLKDKMEALDGKIKDLAGSVLNVSNTVLDLGQTVIGLEYSR